VIENIRVDAEGRIERHCLPCVSPDRRDREIYRLRKEENKSLEEIGEALGCNKSTISAAWTSCILICAVTACDPCVARVA
jgi:DNA-directed RNA polymerase specialized sigma24 family protein